MARMVALDISRDQRADERTTDGVAMGGWVALEHHERRTGHWASTNGPVRAASRNIDYDWVTIGEEKFLLPLLSDVRLTIRQQGQFYETRNLIRFREYQKVGSEVKILDDDQEEIPEDPTNQ